jgi:hypothetical protein
MPLLVVIVNHNDNANAAELVQGFRSLAPVCAIDSGSDLTPEDEKTFDIRLPNVHYSGLFNEATRFATKQTQESEVYFICSDVGFDDYAEALRCATDAFRDPNVGVYAPTANASSHGSMLNRGSGGFRQACFVEGFCFAARLSLMQEMTPVDLEVNRIGWGLDVHLGYLAMKNNQVSVVDDRVIVQHPTPSGYAKDEARTQRNRWYEGLPPKAQRFRALTGNGLAHTRFGVAILNRLSWI